MRARAVIWAWALVAGLAASTLIVGGVAGYRADEASVAVGGEAALDVEQWTAALWVLVGTTVAAVIAAVILTTTGSNAKVAKSLGIPIAVTLIGLVGAAVFMPLLLIGICGLTWLVIRVMSSAWRQTPT